MASQSLTRPHIDTQQHWKTNSNMDSENQTPKMDSPSRKCGLKRQILGVSCHSNTPVTSSSSSHCPPLKKRILATHRKLSSEQENHPNVMITPAKQLQQQQSVEDNNKKNSTLYRTPVAMATITNTKQSSSCTLAPPPAYSLLFPTPPLPPRTLTSPPWGSRIFPLSPEGVRCSEVSLSHGSHSPIPSPTPSSLSSPLSPAHSDVSGKSQLLYSYCNDLIYIYDYFLN